MRLMALDPSFTATGVFVVDVLTGEPVAVDCIRTWPPKASERLTAALANALRGAAIRQAVSSLCREHRPFLVVQEGSAGSKSAKAAGALARAQQACADGVDVELGALPLIVTPQSVKQATCGRLDASKDDLRVAAENRWGAPLASLIDESGIPGSKHENIYDAACVAASVWDRPDVVAVRRIAKGA